MTTWHTPETVSELAGLWPDVDTIDEAVLDVLLDAAKEQVIAYAPALPEDAETIPPRYALGQIRQAQNLWNAARVDASGGVGDGDTFVIRPTPLDWHVKQILRPRRGVPHVG